MTAFLEPLLFLSSLFKGGGTSAAAAASNSAIDQATAAAITSDKRDVAEEIEMNQSFLLQKKDITGETIQNKLYSDLFQSVQQV